VPSGSVSGIILAGNPNGALKQRLISPGVRFGV
jgi:hypothetical protein